MSKNPKPPTVTIEPKQAAAPSNSTARDASFRAGEGIVLRTPLLPMATLTSWADAPDRRAYLAQLIDQPAIREAMFVASPSLYGAIDKWRVAPDSPAGQRVERSLVKYVARMACRSTPFGLFSAVSAGKLGKQTDLAVAAQASYRRRTRLDNDYLFVLAADLAKAHADSLRWSPNSSLYRIAGRIRYAAARLVGKERSYHLVSVETTPYLDATLARAAAGATLAELAAPLVDDEITMTDARGFIDELVESQLLVPALGVHVTGPEPIDGMLAQLGAAGVAGPHAVLADVRGQLAAIDAGGLGNAPEQYRAVATTLEQLGTKVDQALLFQVDMVKPSEATVGVRVAADVAAAIGMLAKLMKLSNQRSLDEFRRTFTDRWEGQTVPLAVVLDEESGIGFEAPRGPGAEGAPLLAGLPFGGAAGENRVAWSRVEEHMLGKLAVALSTGASEIVLDDSDVEAMAAPTPAQLPDAFCAMIRVAGSAEERARGELAILFDGTSGPSGARLLGRFCHASPEIEAIVRAHHATEEALRPDAVFAEIAHLNEGRIGNVLCRPALRAHEIVYLGMSGAPVEQQLGLDDLEVSIRGERIVLTSRKLGREVIPRLTTAHNYQLRSLGAYRFLNAIANQGAEHVMWSWGPLASVPFLPRVKFGRVVLSRATWQLDKRELAPITAAVRAAAKGGVDTVAECVAALRTARSLPRYLVISAGDNELPIDLDNPLLVSAFADELAGSERAILCEMFGTPDRLVAHGPEGTFANEVILTFTRTREPSKAAPAPAPAPTLERSFAPGSEWLSAKLYCGRSTADRVLREAVAPVVRAALANGDATHWFFVRYADPEPHVRVRFAGDPARLAGVVLPALQRAAAELTKVGAVHRLVVDTYVRETERYGGDRGMALIEQLFWRDSEAVLGIVELLDGDAGGAARWKLAVRGIDSLLEVLGLDADARQTLCNEAREGLGREYHANVHLWSKIGDRFAAERADLDVMFARDPARDAAHVCQPGFELLAQRDVALAPIAAELQARDAAGELTPKLLEIAWSVVHMHANRLLHASHRAQELVLYDFVRRLHAAKKARSKK
jgi:lantibiotic biosynthesis protein